MNAQTLPKIVDRDEAFSGAPVLYLGRIDTENCVVELDETDEVCIVALTPDDDPLYSFTVNTTGDDDQMMTVTLDEALAVAKRAFGYGCENEELVKKFKELSAALSE